MAPTPQQDPTMEEILASIRKIISEDASAKAAPAETAQPSAQPDPIPAPAPAPPIEQPIEPEETAAPPADILELTEVVDAPAEETSAPSDDIDFATIHDDPVPDETAAQDSPQIEDHAFDTSSSYPSEDEDAGAPPTESGDDGLFSEKSREALDDALSGIEEAIDDAPKEEPGEPIPAGGERELGAIILNAVRAKIDPAVKDWLDTNRDELIQHIKPIIREWLDETFPAVLADAVRDEVARAVKLRGIKR